MFLDDETSKTIISRCRSHDIAAFPVVRFTVWLDTQIWPRASSS
jgi:hypothetical protein